MNNNQSNCDWGEESAALPPRRGISVVLREPGKLAKTATIEASLERYQRIVGGYIEAYYPLEEPVCIVCNRGGQDQQSAPEPGDLRRAGSRRNAGHHCRDILCLRLQQRRFRQPLSRTAPALYGAVQIPGTVLPNGQRDSSGALSTGERSRALTRCYPIIPKCVHSNWDKRIVDVKSGEAPAR